MCIECGVRSLNHGFEVIKHSSCSTQWSMKFILLINVKMPMIDGILTFMSRMLSVKIPSIVGILTFIISINTTAESFKARKIFFSNI